MKFRWREGRKDRERELQEELDAHFAIDIQQRMQAGQEREEAEFAARRDFGNVTRVKEVTREMINPMIVFETILLDLRYGARLLYRNIGFTVVAVLALAVGIGVNAAVFTAYKAMVGRSVEGRDVHNLVNIALIRPSGVADFHFSDPDYEAYRDSLRSFRGVIAFNPEQMTLSGISGIISQRRSAADSVVGRLGLLPYGASNAEFASVFVVSENYFQVLGVAPLRGRTFESLTIPDLVASPSVLISENYWQKRFAANPAILGATIRLNGTAVHIIGITPHDFVGTGVAVPDFWVPLNLEPLLHSDQNWLRDRENQCCRVFARLASGVSIPQAQAEMAIRANQLRMLHDPHSDAAKPANALVWPGSPFPLPLRFYRGLELTILLIMLAAAMLLVVACANVGSLQVARARSRQHELRTRLSLGASRVRILRQLLTESALLALLAGSVALLFTWALLKISVALYAAALPAEFGTFIFDVTPDLEIFVYVLAISLFAGILFGLAPALESSGSAISSAARGSTSPVSTRRLQNFLITAQVSLSLVLMIAGSMLIRSAIHSLNMQTGYNTKQVVSLNFQFTEIPRYSAERKLAVARELRARLAALPGVLGVTSAHSPQDSGFRTAALAVHGGKASAPSGQSILYYTYVQPNYFETLGIPLFLGRGFPSHGEPGHSVILSESAAKELWPHENPVGRSLRLGPTDERPHNSKEWRADGPAYLVIGVARDTRGVEFDGSDSRQIYLPLRDDGLASRPLLIRTRADPAPIRKAIDPLLSSVDSNLLATSSTLQEMLCRSTPFITASVLAFIASSVGLLGLLLAVMGIYGTVSYIVVLRTREVGIRMALGAEKHDILRLVLRESTRPVLAGLLAGVFLAIGTAQALRGVLYAVSTVDGISLMGVSILFLAIALLAAYPPARRAMRVEPVVALRYE